MECSCEPESRVPANAAVPNAGAPAARLVQVSKRHREGEHEITVLERLSVDFAPARVSVLRGPSGSGKTTLLNLLAGIDVPDAGEVWVAGRPLAGLSDDERTYLRRRHIGIVFQFFNLVPSLSVGENVRLPLDLLGWNRRVADQRCARWLERLGLEDRAGARVQRLSGGERQRVAVARALIHEPALVLADEPTGNLDPATARDVLALLSALVREREVTLVMATHSDEAAGLADDVLDLEVGALERSNPEQRGLGR